MNVAVVEDLIGVTVPVSAIELTVGDLMQGHRKLPLLGHYSQLVLKFVAVVAADQKVSPCLPVYLTVYKKAHYNH